MPNVQEIRDKFRNYNSQTTVARINGNIMLEKAMVTKMNEFGVSFQGMTLKEWSRCTTDKDKYEKIDAECPSPNGTIYAQVKWRQPNSGDDILMAIVQPWPGYNEFKQMLTEETDETLNKFLWARDYKFKGHLYVSMNKEWTMLRVIDYPNVLRPLMTRVLNEYIDSGYALGYNNRCHEASWNPDIQLRWTQDRGRGGYDSGLEKILCFLPISAFDPKDVQLIPFEGEI